MTYNRWKMMDKIDVAVKTAPENPYYGRTFNGYVVEHGDEKALESAKDWAREREYDYDKREYVKVHEPKVHTFDNGGFTVKILESAGGSSQGGRLSFLACEVEKDGISFVIGVNDDLLVDLIKNSTIIKGVIQEKVMFVRKAGRPGFIHEGMKAYEEANADMKLKDDMKKAKKTSKWEIGGIYSSLTQTDMCIGKVFDTMEEVDEQDNTWPYRTRRVLRKREKPVEVYAWVHFYNFHKDKELPKTLQEVLEKEIADDDSHWFPTGKPPARAKTGQLEVKDSDYALLDKLLKMREDQVYYGDPKYHGRFVRELK